MVCQGTESESWVAFSEFEPQYRYQSENSKLLLKHPIFFKIQDLVITQEDIVNAVPLKLKVLLSNVSGEHRQLLLVTKGLVIDHIQTSFPSFHEKNIQQHLLSAYKSLQNRAAHTVKHVEEILHAIGYR